MNNANARARRLRFVVNADDLGYSCAVNSAIEACAASRRITSATIIANGPAYEDAIRCMRRHQHVSIGVHLNATEFAPITQAKFPGIMEGGCFSNRLREQALTLPLLRALAEEFDAQVSKVKQSGVRVSHLDSHHHIHTVPQLFLIMLAIARKHGIHRFRPTRNIYKASAMPSLGLRLKKWSWRAAVAVVGVRQANYFGGLAEFIETDMAFRDNSLIEIMVHPGGGGRYVSESELLNTKWWLRHCDEAEFGSYYFE